MKKSSKITAAGVLLFLIAAGIFSYKIYQKYLVRDGVAITPSLQVVCEEPSFYLQKDEEWGDDHLGQSIYTMKSSGCLVTSMAAALEMENREEDAAFRLTPGELNRLFSEHSVYNQNGDIVWKELPAALPEAEVYVASAVKEKEIQALLSEGKYPLIKVRIGGTGAIHWLVIMGADESSYLCMDPLNGKRSLVPLSQFGNVVYAMRCVSWKKDLSEVHH